MGNLVLNLAVLGWALTLGGPPTAPLNHDRGTKGFPQEQGVSLNHLKAFATVDHGPPCHTLFPSQ